MDTLGVIIFVVAAAPAPWVSQSTAIVEAANDAARLPADDVLFSRWAWCPNAGNRPLISFAVNSAVADLRNSQVYRPVQVSPGLVRIDLRRLSDSPAKAAAVWEKLVDPYLYATARKLVDVPPYVATDGKSYSKKWQGVVSFGGHLPPEAIVAGEALQQLTGSRVPIVRAEELIRRSMTALDDGLYYEFLGIPNDYDAFLKLIGADQTRSGQLSALRKAAMIRSKVTDVPRAVLVFPTLSVGPNLGAGNHFITLDVGKDDRQVAQHPLRNLLDSKFRAGEACTEANNGRLVWTLWSFDAAGKGTLQRSVPDDIAQDGTVLHPHDRRLQASVSCWRCHLQEQHDGFKPVVNDVVDLLRGGVDVFGDASRIDGVRTITDLYNWNGDKLLSRARDDFAEFCVQTTNANPNAVGEQLRAFFDSYWHAGVSPETALAELGLPPAKKGEAAKRLKDALPPVPLPIAPGVVPEDVVLGLLKIGRTVTRRDWESVYQEAFRRAARR